MASEQKVGVFVDPRLAKTIFGDWVSQWKDSHDVGEGTWAKYNSHPANHILPRFGDMPLGDISRMAIKGWIRTLRRRLAEPTVIDSVTLLSMTVGEAVDEELIGSNPAAGSASEDGNAASDHSPSPPRWCPSPTTPPPPATGS